MFSIYKYMFDNGMCDKNWLLSCVPDASLSQDEYNRIVGDNNATASQAQSAQPQA